MIRRAHQDIAEMRLTLDRIPPPTPEEIDQLVRDAGSKLEELHESLRQVTDVLRGMT